MGALMYFLIWIFLQPFRLLICNWKIEGLENLPDRPQGFVLATNHISWFDILVIGSSLPLRYRPWWVAKVELFNGRFADWWLHEMQAIPIRRGKRDLSAMYASEEALKQGAVLVVFTEGTRNKQGTLQEGRGGAVRLSHRSHTPIVPAAVTGTEGGFSGALFRRLPIRLIIGQPYRPKVEQDSIPPDQMNILTEEMMVKIAELLPEERWGFYRERMLALKQEQSQE